MAEQLILQSTPRGAMGTRASRRLRKEGQVPLTFHAKGEKPLHLQAPERDVRQMLRAGQRILTLGLPQGQEKVFLKEIQLDHLGEAIYHIDFTRVAMDEMLDLEVELVLKGKPVGVVEEGGVLDQYVKEIEISCLPDAIPERIEVDVTGLKLNEHLTIGDVTAPSGVKLTQDPELVLASVTEHKEEEVVAAEAEPGPAEPELISKEKPEEEAASEEEKKEKKEKKG